MATLDRIYVPDSSQGKLNLVFVHGLGGHPRETWMHDPKDSATLWPSWLGEESGCPVWLLGYDAALSGWTAGAMPLPSQGTTVLDLLVSEPNLKGAPVVMVGHSLGGLVIKMALSNAETQGVARYQSFVKQLKGVVFVATPHFGAELATLANVLKVLLRSNEQVGDLRAHNPYLLNLNAQFRAMQQKLGFAVRSYSETRGVTTKRRCILFRGPTIQVVSNTSSEPGIVGETAISLPEDHLSICKPTDRNAQIVKSLLDFLSELQKKLDQEQAAFAPQQSIQSERASPTSGSVAAFRQSYLVSDKGGQPFGGRQEEFERLTSWLNDGNAPSRMLVTAPTGRGKSALFVRWTEAAVADGSWTVVFLPISIRFGTNRPATYYEYLASRLAAVLGKSLPLPPLDPEGFYRGSATLLLQELANSACKVLIVVDGIDEALEFSFTATVFPEKLPSNIKILLSAREQANDNGPKGWLERLDWDSNGRAKSMNLSRLDRSAIAGVLESVGITSRQVNGEIVDRVVALSEGEPLLVKLYAEDLSEMASQGVAITVTALEGVAPGFAAYFARAFDHQNAAWKESGAEVNQETIDSTLAVLACAFGPLEREHLTSLVSTISGLPYPASPDRFVKPLARFVSGNGRRDSGYVLNHPKLGQYLRDDRFDKTVLQATDSAFARWGCAEADALVGNPAAQPPPYVLQYLADHIHKAGGSLDDYARLLTNEWRLAWDRFEGGYHGYSSSLQSILKRLGPTAQYGPRWTAALQVRIKIGLCLASVKSMGTNIPAELLSLALDNGLLTTPQAMHIIDMQLPDNHPGYFSAVFRHVGREQVDKIIDLIYQAKDASNRSYNLAQIADHVAEPRRHQLVQDALTLARDCGNPAHALAVATRLAPLLTDAQLSQVLSNALLIPLAYDNRISCATSLAELATHLIRKQASDQAASAIRYCLELFDAQGDPLAKVEALAKIAGKVPANEVKQRLEELTGIVGLLQKQAASNVGSLQLQAELQDGRRRRAVAILKLLKSEDDSPAEYNLHFAEALNELSGIHEHFRINWMVEIFDIIRPTKRNEFTNRLLVFARQLPSGNNRTHALMAIAKAIQPADQLDIIREALLHARLIEDRSIRCRALIALFSQLSAEERLSEMAAVRAEIDQVLYVLDRGELLIELSSLIPTEPSMFAMGIQLIQMASDLPNRVSALLRVLPKIPEPMRQPIFRYCWNLSDVDDSTRISFCIFADSTSRFWNEEDLRRAFGWCTTSSQWGPHLIVHLFPIAVKLDALDIADSIFQQVMARQDPSERLADVARMVPHLPPSYKRRLEIDRIWPHVVQGGITAKPGILLNAYPLLGQSERPAAWTVLKASALSSQDATVLGTLSEVCTDQNERSQLLELAFSIVAESSAEVRTGGGSELATHCRADSARLRALDLMTDEPWTHRSNFLGHLQRVAPVLKALEDATLLYGIMNCIRENAEWWP